VNHQKNPRSLIKSLPQTLAIQFAILIGRVLSHKSGFKLASLIGALLGSMKNHPMIQAIRANQWVIHDQSLTEKELEVIPKMVLQSAAKCLFDYFYHLPRPEKLREIVSFSPTANIAVERIKNNQPCVIVCPHLSNFDLMGYVLALNHIKVQVLSYPNPNAAYKLQNHLREKHGMMVTPMSLSTFRQARTRLKQGGSILTGLDRPLEIEHHEKYQPEFFGYKTNLPVTYVRMAKEAHAPVIVLAATSQSDGKYCLDASRLIWMESAEDLETEILHNVNRVLKEAEVFIKKYPYQWAMLYPVWPQFLGVKSHQQKGNK